ncbi:MAG: InlB B-repeat-containing protein [Clostridiales bacterium]|nr:InlB B-repeat-containing protein [Clostridiales bacterium]
MPLNLSTISNIYSSTPSLTAPYSAGTLTDSFIKTGTDYLNFIRFVSGLGEVSIDDTYEEYAQHSAAIQAIIGGDLNHYPSQPSDMDDDFYEKAYYGSRHGNLDAGYGRNLGYAVQGWLDDDSSSSNLSTVGHRRWVLNPYMLYAGFGYVENSSAYYGSYGSMYAHDESNEDIDFYDFIAYPSQGNFPEELISNSVPWCISLNTSLYKVESASDINVTVTKESSGKTWSFSQSDYKSSPSTSSKYFLYDTVGCGIDSCIIFGFGSSNISSSELDGDFTVTVTGLKDPDGNDTSFTYTTTLFSLSSSSSGSGSSSSSSSGSSSSGGSSGGGGSAAAKYTVYFKPNNGEDTTSKSITKNTAVAEPTDPTYEGYTFIGWYTDEECENLYDFSTKVISSFTLYAGWEVDEDYIPETTEAEDEEESEPEETEETAVSREIRVSIGNKIVLVDGTEYEIDAAPYIQTDSSSTLVPLRFVAIAIMGENVDNADTSSNITWEANTKTASIITDNGLIQFTVGSSYMIVNGEQKLMSNGVKAEITDGRMFIPFRALGEALGVDVDWDSDSKTAIYKAM